MDLGSGTIDLGPFLPWIEGGFEMADAEAPSLRGRTLVVDDIPGAEYGGREAAAGDGGIGTSAMGASASAGGVGPSTPTTNPARTMSACAVCF